MEDPEGAAPPPSGRGEVQGSPSPPRSTFLAAARQKEPSSLRTSGHRQHHLSSNSSSRPSSAGDGTENEEETKKEKEISKEVSDSDPAISTSSSRSPVGASQPRRQATHAAEDAHPEIVYMGQDGMAMVRQVPSSLSSSTSSSSSSPSSGEAKQQKPSVQYAFYRPPTKRVYRKLEGWLWKRGANAVLAGWKRRYFSLKDNRLYYSPLLNSNPINYILLTSETRIEMPTQPDPRFPNGCFHIHTSYTRRVFVLAVEGGESELERWVAGLREVVKLLADRYSLHKDFIRKYILPPDECSDETDASSSPSTPLPRSPPTTTSEPQPPTQGKALTRLVGPQTTRASPLRSSASERVVVDLLVTGAHLNTNDKHVLAAGRAGLYLEISLGTQSLRSWIYNHSGGAEGIHSTRESHGNGRPPDKRWRSSLDSLPRSSSTSSLASLASSASEPACYLWAGLNCTFNDEGSGEGALNEGQLRIALVQAGTMRAVDIIVDEQFIDISDLSQDDPQELSLEFYIAELGSSDTGIRAQKPTSFRSVRPNEVRQGEAVEKSIPSTRPDHQPDDSKLSNGSSSRQRFDILPISATGELTTQQSTHQLDREELCEDENDREPSEEDSDLLRHLLSTKMANSAANDLITRLEAGILPHRERSFFSTTNKPFTSSPSKVREPACTVTLIVQKSAGSFDKSSLLHQRGIASTSVPMRLDTGDVVLFNNSHIMAYGTKFFTMSQWDHVAMVVRWWNNELKLLEATLEDGVEVYNFDDRMEFLRTVSKVAVRQLSVQRTPEMIDGLYRFIDEVQGRPFQKNRMAMVKAWSGLNTEEDLSSLFCSELTAAAYKRMGLVKEAAKTSNNYLPSCWAGKGRMEDTRIPLRPDVRLERKVVFPKV